MSIGFFKVLGILVAAYAGSGLVTGAIYGRSGIGGRTFQRDDDAFGYWSAIVAYFVLALMLLFFF